MLKNLGIILLIAGAALGIYGYYEYNAAVQSLGDMMNKLFTGKSQAETRAVLLMICGGAAALIGLVLTLSGRRRKR